MSVASELEVAERVASDVEDLTSLEPAVDGADARRTLERLLERRLGDMYGVRFSVGARLLGVSVPTLRSWVDRGLIEEVAPDRSGRRVSLKRIVELRPVVAEIQNAGKRRNVLEAVVARLEDREWLNDPKLRESLAQLRRGDLVDITPGK